MIGSGAGRARGAVGVVGGGGGIGVKLDLAPSTVRRVIWYPLAIFFARARHRHAAFNLLSSACLVWAWSDLEGTMSFFPSIL